jgi:tetratricopeptide (TPR) repeat protein
MNPKKQKAKDRRRARMLAEQAWEAANQGNLDLAEKIIRRAVSTQEDNPVLWNDQGVILSLRHKDGEAAKSFAAALSLAPTFADAYAHLATLRLRQGCVEEALGLQTQAVKYAPQNAAYAEQLQAYQALAGQLPPHADPHAAATVDPTEVASADPGNDWPQRLATLEWHALANRLTREGYAVIAGLVDAPTCEGLCGLFDDDRLISKTVVMDRPEFGKGVYRYFRAPIPKVVDQLRRAVYPHVARIANE